MLRLIIAGCLAVVTVPASAAEIQGYLADWQCVQQIVKNGADKTFKNDKNCSLQKNYSRAAYGVITDDKQYFRLDDAGNQQAKQLLANSPSKDQVHVIITGDLSGDLIKVKEMSIL